MREPFILYVGLGHKARHGKDEAARSILAARGDQFDIRKYAFGDALKAEVNELDQFAECISRGIKYDINPPMDDPMCQTKHGKQSRLLQFWGEHKRAQDKFYWVKKLQGKIRTDSPQVALISDVRYLSEFYWIKSNGGYLSRISRQGFVDLSRDPNHISETELNNAKWDFDVNVLDGEVEQLRKDAVTMFDLIIDAVTPVVEDMSGVVAQAA